MNVVSNTSPLTNLAAIGYLGVLRQLYGRVVIAEAVWHELNANAGIWPGAAEVAAASWIEQCQPTNNALIITLQRDLDVGEAASIALALEINADIILLFVSASPVRDFCGYPVHKPDSPPRSNSVIRLANNES